MFSKHDLVCISVGLTVCKFLQIRNRITNLVCVPRTWFVDLDGSHTLREGTMGADTKSLSIFFQKSCTGVRSSPNRFVGQMVLTVPSVCSLL